LICAVGENEPGLGQQGDRVLGKVSTLEQAVWGQLSEMANQIKGVKQLNGKSEEKELLAESRQTQRH
jgi:hypothetical protein